MLNNIDSSPPNHLKKKEIKRELKQLKEKMIAFQKKMNAQGKYSLLLVFQGMDASGKDGATRRVLEGVNPSGIKVKSYKKPTDEEFAHDFLWRVHQHTPAKGMIQVFNRSHYEDILVPSVMGYIPKEEIEKLKDQIKKQNHKNIFGTLEAFEKFTRDRKDVKLKIVGDEETQHVVEKIKSLGIETKVEILGAQQSEDIAKLMQGCLAFILFSNYENLPCVLEEAQACGSRIISTNVGGIEEHFKHDEENVFLLKPNEVDKL
mgnify:CR=1 FL=1